MIFCISLLLDSGCGVVVLDLCKDFVDFCIRIYVVHKRKLLHMINFEKERNGRKPQGQIWKITHGIYEGAKS